jgi:hypothetical protein
MDSGSRRSRGSAGMTQHAALFRGNDLWTIRPRPQFARTFSILAQRIETLLSEQNHRVHSSRIEPTFREGKYMRIQHASLNSTNPCPICGVETTLAEIAPHPMHVNFEIHGYFCERCGPVKSLVVLCSPPQQLAI